MFYYSKLSPIENSCPHLLYIWSEYTKLIKNATWINNLIIVILINFNQYKFQTIMGYYNSNTREK